eukprot:TRINITY_DN11284_c0_g1_i1.p1 TRINITY_DN11284_c0_g1~~TRINITY_DN11284_c0_g1_i1.p1  ORF type:complete len:1049 (-),score=334.97 TRINITY_DN11284_c0_g1_i1:36-3182(-)
MQGSTVDTHSNASSLLLPSFQGVSTIFPLRSRLCPWPRVAEPGRPLDPPPVVVLSIGVSQNIGENFNVKVAQGLRVQAALLDTLTGQPHQTISLESFSSIAEVDSDLSQDLGQLAFRFHNLKLKLNQSSVQKQEEESFLLAFTLINCRIFPPSTLSCAISSWPIRIVQKTLHSPSLLKVYPDRIFVGTNYASKSIGLYFDPQTPVHSSFISSSSSQYPINGSVFKLSNSAQNSLLPDNIEGENLEDLDRFEASCDNLGNSSLSLNWDEKRKGIYGIQIGDKGSIKCVSMAEFENCSEVFRVVRDGDANSMQELLEEGVYDINQMDSQGMTPLHWACLLSKPELVKILLSRGASVEVRDRFLESPVFMAIRGKDYESLNQLLGKGCELNVTNAGGSTPLMVAIMEGDEKIIRLLSEKTKNVIQVDRSGLNSFHLLALKMSSVKTLTYMIRAFQLNGQDLHAALDFQQRSFAHWASFYSYDLLVVYLEYSFRTHTLNEIVNRVDGRGETPLFYAVRSGDSRPINALLECGSNPNATNSEGRNALYFASNSDFISRILSTNLVRRMQSFASIPIAPEISFSSPKMNSSLSSSTNASMSAPTNIMHFSSPPPFSHSRLDIERERKETSEKFIPTGYGGHSEAVLKVQNPEHSKENPSLGSGIVQPTNIVKIESKEEVKSNQPVHPLERFFKEQKQNEPNDEEDYDDEEDEEDMEEEIDLPEFVVRYKAPNGFVNLGKLQLYSEDMTLIEARKRLENSVGMTSATFFHFPTMGMKIEPHQEQTMKLMKIYSDKVIILIGKEPVKAQPSATTAVAPITANTNNVTQPAPVPTRSMMASPSLSPVSASRVGSLLSSPVPPNVPLIRDEDVDKFSENWLRSQQHGFSDEMAFDKFLEVLLTYPHSKEQEAMSIAGIKHFFQYVLGSRTKINPGDLAIFLKFYGPIDQSLSKVYQTYSFKYFHGFLTSEEATTLLKTLPQPGGFLFRYSESKFNEGCFALNARKSNNPPKSFPINYRPSLGKFEFGNKLFSNLEELSLAAAYQMQNGIPNSGKLVKL